MKNVDHHEDGFPRGSSWTAVWELRWIGGKVRVEQANMMKNDTKVWSDQSDTICMVCMMHVPMCVWCGEEYFRMECPWWKEIQSPFHWYFLIHNWPLCKKGSLWEWSSYHPQSTLNTKEPKILQCITLGSQPIFDQWKDIFFQYFNIKDENLGWSAVWTRKKIAQKA